MLDSSGESKTYHCFTDTKIDVDWLQTHVFISNYCLKIAKWNGLEYCQPMRTDAQEVLREKFLPTPLAVSCAPYLSNPSHTALFIWDRWDLRWRHHPWRSRSAHGSRYHWWTMLDTKYGKISWKNLGNWIWITIYDIWVGHYVLFFVCLLFFMFSRLSHSVLISDIITFINDPQMAFSALEFSKIVFHYLLSDMGVRGGKLVTNGDMVGGGG